MEGDDKTRQQLNEMSPETRKKMGALKRGVGSERDGAWRIGRFCGSRHEGELLSVFAMRDLAEQRALRGKLLLVLWSHGRRE